MWQGGHGAQVIPDCLNSWRSCWQWCVTSGVFLGNGTGSFASSCSLFCWFGVFCYQKKKKEKKSHREKKGFLPFTKEIKQKQSITTEPVSKRSMIHNSSAATDTSLYLLLGANTNSASDCCSQRLGHQFPRSLSTFNAFILSKSTSTYLLNENITEVALSRNEKSTMLLFPDNHNWGSFSHPSSFSPLVDCSELEPSNTVVPVWP